MTLYFESNRGCGIRLTVEEIENEHGTYDEIKLIRAATPRDISWVRAMGGYVPKEVVL